MHTQITHAAIVDIFTGDNPVADTRLTNAIVGLRTGIRAFVDASVRDVEWADKVAVGDGLEALWHDHRNDDVTVMLFAGLLQTAFGVPDGCEAHVRQTLFAMLRRPVSLCPPGFRDEVYAALMASKTWGVCPVAALEAMLAHKNEPVNPEFDDDVVIAAGEEAGVAAATRDRELFVARKKLQDTFSFLREALLSARSPAVADAAAINFAVDPVRVAVDEHWNGPNSSDMFHNMKRSDLDTVKAVFGYLFATVNPFAPDAARRGTYLVGLLERLTDKCRLPSATRCLMMDVGVLKLVVGSQMMLPCMAEFLRNHILFVVPVEDQDDAAYQTKAFLASHVVAMTASCPATLDTHVLKRVKSPTLARYLLSAMSYSKMTLPDAVTADMFVPLVHLVADSGGDFGELGWDFRALAHRDGGEPSAAVAAALALLPEDDE